MNPESLEAKKLYQVSRTEALPSLKVQLVYNSPSELNLWFRIRIYMISAKNDDYNLSIVSPSLTKVNIKIGCYKTKILGMRLKELPLGSPYLNKVSLKNDTIVPEVLIMLPEAN